MQSGMLGLYFVFLASSFLNTWTCLISWQQWFILFVGCCRGQHVSSIFAYVFSYSA